MNNSSITFSYMSNARTSRGAPISTCSVDITAATTSVKQPMNTNLTELASMTAPSTAQLVSQLAAQNKRKEKARIAARARRSQEANIIMEMAVELHITQEKMRRIDKATIVKLAIDYIKAFEILCKLRNDQQNNQPEITCLKTATSSGPTSIARPPLQQKQQHQQQQQQHQHQHREQQKAPTLNTQSIFAPKTEDMDSHFLIIDRGQDGRSSIVLKPDTEILDDDDLTHLAPQAGDVSISLEVETLEGIVLDTSLFGGPNNTSNTGASSPPLKKGAPILMERAKDLIDNSYCYISSIGSVD